MGASSIPLWHLSALRASYLPLQRLVQVLTQGHRVDSKAERYRVGLGQVTVIFWECEGGGHCFSPAHMWEVGVHRLICPRVCRATKGLLEAPSSWTRREGAKVTDSATLSPLGEGNGEHRVGRAGEPRAFVGNILMFHPPGD